MFCLVVLLITWINFYFIFFYLQNNPVFKYIYYIIARYQSPFRHENRTHSGALSAHYLQIRTSDTQFNTISSPLQPSHLCRRSLIVCQHKLKASSSYHVTNTHLPTHTKNEKGFNWLSRDLTQRTRQRTRGNLLPRTTHPTCLRERVAWNLRPHRISPAAATTIHSLYAQPALDSASPLRDPRGRPEYG